MKARRRAGHHNERHHSVLIAKVVPLTQAGAD
jgi:hypothetical protein